MLKLTLERLENQNLSMMIPQLGGDPGEDRGGEERRNAGKG
jgi:hypothetical protein